MDQAAPQPPDRPVPRPDYAPAERIGDAERERAVAALSEHYAVGRLDRAELDTRVETAYRARVVDELRALFADLPGSSPFPDPVPVSQDPRRGGHPPYGRSRGHRGGAPVLPLLLVLAVVVMVATGGHAFWVLPMVWFWVGMGRRTWGPPRR